MRNRCGRRSSPKLNGERRSTRSRCSSLPPPIPCRDAEVAARLVLNPTWSQHPWVSLGHPSSGSRPPRPRNILLTNQGVPKTPGNGQFLPLVAKAEIGSCDHLPSSAVPGDPHSTVPALQDPAERFSRRLLWPQIGSGENGSSNSG